MTKPKSSNRTQSDESAERERESGSVPARTGRVLGPAGGRTTVSRDGTMIKKTFFLDFDTEAELRKEAFLTRRSEGDILREQARRRYFPEPGSDTSKEGRADRAAGETVDSCSN